MTWWLKALYVADKALNFLTFGKRWETVSSRMGTCIESPTCPSAGKAVSKALCGLLDKLDKGHCHDAIERARLEQLRARAK